jgi:septum formation protein
MLLALILASSSAIRRQMLDAAGVEHEAIPSNIDEAEVKVRKRTPEEISSALAHAKALRVNMDHPRDWVIGSDSVVSVKGALFDKPADRKEATDHLRFFSGKTLLLTSAVSLVGGFNVEWSHVETAELKVRSLSDSFIEGYLDAEWPDVAYCVGVFRMEGRGVQLFEHIEGDYFTILGMPLLPLLAALRREGVLPP